MRFGLTIFLSAFLVFQIQPIVGKAVLPWFGGGAAVWTICLLFFQCQLLAGYAYAHVIATRLSRRTQRLVHLIVLGLAISMMAGQLAAGNSPILPSAAWQPTDPEHPVAHLLALLACTIGLPYLALAATAPLIQSWFSRARPAASPYRLYALSNAGSLLALVTYPFVVEPNLTLHAQALVWSIAFVVFAIGSTACARVPELAPVATEDAGTAPGRSAWFVWLAAPACASTMLLATTNQLCQAVAPVPFLWVLPLAIYLLSFVLCFQSDRIYRRGIFGPLLVVGIAAAAYVAENGTLTPQRSIAVYGIALFAVCMTCHGELARARPASRWLTAYYLTSAAGGALGGIFVGIIAPLVFDNYWELFVALLVTPVLAIIFVARDPRSWLRSGTAWPAYAVLIGAIGFAAYVRGDPWFLTAIEWPTRSIGWIVVKLAVAALVVIATRRWWLRVRRPRVAASCLGFAVACLGLVVLRDVHWLAGEMTTSKRGFYGVLSIAELDRGQESERVMLYHGQIIHGAQYHDARWRDSPTTYYSDRSGIGRVLLGHPDRARPLRIGMVGLGTGSVAVFARAGDTLRFYDIDPDVVALSRGPHPVFTYLADSPATIDVVLGDARLSLEHEPPQHFDVLAIDAFAGDAIPVHLLTREAIAADLAQLGDDGLLVIHISNLYLDLEPVLAAHVATLGLAAAVVDLEEDDQTWGSTWVVLARDAALIERTGLVDDTRQLRGDPVPWTDDESNLLRILR